MTSVKSLAVMNRIGKFRAGMNTVQMPLPRGTRETPCGSWAGAELVKTRMDQ